MAERQQYSRDVVKKMADLLRAGATMLGERCPICGLPLFRLKSGEVVCPVHGRVLIVSSESEYTRAAVEGVLEALERLAASKIQSIADKLSTTGSREELGELTSWLDVLERVERVRSLMQTTLGRREEKEEAKK